MEFIKRIKVSNHRIQVREVKSNPACTILLIISSFILLFYQEYQVLTVYSNELKVQLCPAEVVDSEVSLPCPCSQQSSTCLERMPKKKERLYEMQYNIQSHMHPSQKLCGRSSPAVLQFLQLQQTLHIHQQMHFRTPEGRTVN